MRRGPVLALAVAGALAVASGALALWPVGAPVALATAEGDAQRGASHTDRNLVGRRKPHRHLMGSDDLPGGGKAPPITPGALRCAGWDVDALAFALKSGVKPDGDTFGGGMGEVVQRGTAWLRPEDRAAIAAYLLDGE